jgi:hypothetical protein
LKSGLHKLARSADTVCVYSPSRFGGWVQARLTGGPLLFTNQLAS